MISLDLFKSNERLRAERQAEKRVEYRQRLDMPSRAVAPTPKMEMRMQARVPEPQRQAPTQSAQKPRMKESSYIRGGRMSMTPDENIGSHTLMPRSSYTPEQGAELRGGRFPAAPISEPGISGSGFGWKR